MLQTRKAWLLGLPDLLQNLKFKFITGNLITMLCLLKNTTFSTAVHRVSDIKDVRTKFETSDTQLLNTLSPKQAGLFADWYGRGGGGRDLPPSNFCLNRPIDLKFDM